MFVLTIDQRHSRTETDRVPVLLDILREVCATSPPLAGFERTVGDEIQGLFGDAAGGVAAVRAVVREGGWHLGIGIGLIEGVPATVREGRGSAFVSAREAVDAAKSSGDVAVRAGGDACVACHQEDGNGRDNGAGADSWPRRSPAARRLRSRRSGPSTPA